MLYSFDLSSLNITDSEKISKAKFSIYAYFIKTANDLSLPEKVYRMTQPWDEETVNWSSFGSYSGHHDDEYFDHNVIDSTLSEDVLIPVGKSKLYSKEYAAWNATAVYGANAGNPDTVSYNNHLWQSKWYNQGMTPGGTDYAWNDLGGFGWNGLNSRGIREEYGPPLRWLDFDLTEVVKFWIEYPDSNFGIIVKFDDYSPLVGIDQPKDTYNLFGGKRKLYTIIQTEDKKFKEGVQWDKLAKLEIEYGTTAASINSGNITNLKESDHFSWEGEKLTISKNSLCKNVKIYTINGVLVKSLAVSGDNRVMNYSNLAKGLYLFQFLTNNNSPLFNKKVIVH